MSSASRLISLSLSIVLLFSITATAETPRSIYEVKIYHFKSKEQEVKIEAFLKNAFIPALHRNGISKVGVYKPIEKDTANFGKKIFVFIPYKNIDQFVALSSVLQNDSEYQKAGADYLNSAFNTPPYTRIESLLTRAFVLSPQFEVPVLTGPKSDQIYELRSYESATENIFINKVKMFNAGDEIGLFKRLGFNSIFYAEVLSGSRMPNLVYMTSFNSFASREEHWKAFNNDPQWTKLKADPQYQNNVSKADIYLMHPAEYSEL